MRDKHTRVLKETACSGLNESLVWGMGDAGWGAVPVTTFETVAKKFETSRILQTNERTTENTKNLREPTTTRHGPKTQLWSAKCFQSARSGVHQQNLGRIAFLFGKFCLCSFSVCLALRLWLSFYSSTSFHFIFMVLWVLSFNCICTHTYTHYCLVKLCISNGYVCKDIWEYVYQNSIFR